LGDNGQVFCRPLNKTDLKKTIQNKTQITNVFWGDMRQEIFNSQTFVDTKNNMRATVNYGPPVLLYKYINI
jgi:hypothetical protein